MKILRLLLPCLVLSIISTVPATSQTQTPLDDFAWLVGGTWIAEVKPAEGKAPLRIESTCRWSENKRQIQFVTHFITPDSDIARYEGFYAWHPGKQKVAYWYTDEKGNFSEGTAAPQGEIVEFELANISATGQVMPIRSEIRREGADAYSWKAYIQKDGEWTEAVSLRYVRRKQSARVTAQ
jgi:hypothetical protein